jgi:fumarylpyruvate hydrolase
MSFVIPAPLTPALPVAGGGLFPIRRVWCVGRNYAEHAREMGHDPNREAPFFFMKPANAIKPADAVVPNGGELPFPVGTKDLHHEIELVVAMGRAGAAIHVAAALDHVWGYAVGLDMTRRDLQAEAKKAGRPWEMGKAFDRSAPMSALVPASRIGHPATGAIRLSVNGVLRQSADLKDLIWNVPETIAHLSRLIELAPGDLIMTGTPAGVAAVKPGDVLEGEVEGVGTLRVTYAGAMAKGAAARSDQAESV